MRAFASSVLLTKKLKRMSKKNVVILLMVIFTLPIMAQKGLYIKPEIASVWNSYQETAYEYNGLDNSFLASLYLGYQFENKLILESGVQYQNAEIEHTLMHRREDDYLSSSVSVGKKPIYLYVPVNVKYSINTEIENFKLVPYVGLTLVNNLSEQGVYDTEYITDVATNDTAAVIVSEGISKTGLLINLGLGLEYDFKHFSVSMSGNYSGGLNTLNQSTLYLASSTDMNDGKLLYKGSKFYFAFGIKVPIGSF